MAAFVPIVYRTSGSYLICCLVSREHSYFEEYEFIPRDMYDEVVRQAASQGEIVKPFIHYGLH